MRRSALLTVLLTFACTPAAVASTAGVQGTTLSVTAGSGERNRITVAPSGSTSVRVSDGGASLRPGAGCTASSSRSVLCPRTALTDLVVDLADQSDRVDVSRSLTLRSRLRGGTANDTLVGGGGPDELDGGTGRDIVSYSSRTDPVTVTLGGGADDGAPGEGDNVIAVETLIGSAAGDTITGGGAAERLEGRGGDDRMDGGGGNDGLYGGAGDDALAGGSGNDAFVASSFDGRDVFTGGPGGDVADYRARTVGVVADPDGRPDDGTRPGGALNATGLLPAIALLRSDEGDTIQPDVESLRGGRGDDVLAAGPSGGSLSGFDGTDVLLGGPGTDRFEGGNGFDRIASRDGRAESVNCGPQVDRVFTSGSDRVAGDCERQSASFAVVLAPVQRTLRAGTELPVRVTCPAQAAVRCVGAVRLVTVRRLRSASTDRSRAATLGAARFNAPSGTTVEAVVRLSESGRAALSRLGNATRVRLAARGRDEAGAARPAAARFILRAR